MPTVPHNSLNPVLIQLEQVSVHRDDRDILKKVDFALHENEIVSLIGPNAQRHYCVVVYCLFNMYQV